MTTAIVKVPFRGGEVLTAEVDGRPHVVLKPAIESIGLDYATQLTKLKRRSWATVGQCPTVAEDGKVRDMVTVDVRTFLMLLATVDEARVAEHVRAQLVAYQSEVADAIESYWTKGGAINTRATEDQLAVLISRAEAQARVLQSLRGICQDDWLEAQGRILASRALGIEPDLDPSTRPLTVDEYLEARGLPRKRCNEIRVPFGKALAAAYRNQHGTSPIKGDRNIAGRITKVNTYSERDRQLFDAVWLRFSGGAS